MAVFLLDTKNFVFGVLFLFALFEVLIIWNMKGTINVRDNKHSNYEESCLDILSSSETKDYCNCSVIHHRELENQENTNAKPSSCPLDEIWQKENNTRFPENHFAHYFSHESQWKDSRAVRVFSRLRIPQEMKVFREFMLSQKEIDFYRTVEPAKLSSSTEEIFCREPSRSYLKELTEKCRTGAKRSFVDGGYCTRPHQKAWILEIDCAWVDENSFHGDIFWSTWTDTGEIIQSQLERKMVPKVKSHMPVRHLDVLASPGYSVYPGAPGHFPVEILPRLVRMYNEIPKHVPLIWPSNPFAKKFYLLMKELGIIDGTRPLVETQLGTVMRARKLFLYHADDDTFPHMNIAEFLYLSQLLNDSLEQRFGKPQISSKKVITVIHRLGAGSRVVSNHRDVMNKVQEQFSKEHIVQEYIIDQEQSQNMIRIAQKFFESDIIVSPHGASLGNIIFCRPHVTSIVELSWDNNSDMFLPADYMCFSRNLKIRYSVVAGKGKHTSMLEIPPDDVVTAIRDHLEHLPKR